MWEPSLGLRVVRGPDWEWGDQDGGEGFVGTVASLEEDGGMVIVQWDMGQRCRYRCGQDKFDLRVLDSGPIGKLKNFSLSCDWCQEDVVGCVWRCVRCLDYYLCSQCYMTDKHSTQHPFFRILSSDLKNRERLSSRRESRKLKVRGIFCQAHVIRGSDWRWGDQDGGTGTRGQVVAIKNWQKESLRSVAEVRWGMAKSSNIYRLGYKGKVDLQCVEPTEGGYCYPDHLPILGVGDVGGRGMAPSSQRLAAGDTVKVELEIAILRMMQEDHGGWNDNMSSVIGQAAVVNYIFEDGDPELRYITNQIYKFNIEAVSKVEGLVVYFVGDVVMVIDDMALVHDLQKDGPGWVDDMVLTLGQIGVVTKLTLLSHVQVSVNGKRWVYNPQCLVRVPDDQLPDSYGEEDVDMNTKAQLLTMMHSVDKFDAIVYAATAGDVSTVQRILEQHPEEVNRMVEGRTAVHEACKEGYITVLKVLLNFNPDLEECNSGKALSLLVEHGVDINSKDANENTALMVAAALGHNVVLAVILAHPLLNIQAGGPIGNTALQCATSARRGKSVSLLLEAGADPSIADYTASTPLHLAAGMGHYSIMEKLLMYFPEHINLQKADDGYSSLHIAVANKHCDVAELLVQQGSCNVNIRTSESLTPLHIAAHEGHSAVVELLVGYGADLNATADNGNTPLHLVLARTNMKPLNTNTPYLMQVQEKLETVFERKDFAPYTVVACMMLLEGADLYLKNSNSDSPLSICPPHISDTLRHVVKKCGRGTYHGNLCKFSIPLPKMGQVKRESTAVAATGDKIVKTIPPKDLGKDSHSDNVEKALKLPPPAEESKDEHSNSDHEVAAKTPNSDRQEDKSDDRLCCMCDQEVNVRLSPCGHTVMCSDCAHIARRCPTCRVPIEKRLVIT